MFSKTEQYVTTLRPWRELNKGQGRAVFIMTCYSLGGPGFKRWWERFFLLYTCPNQPWGPPSLLYDGYLGSFQEVKWPGHGHLGSFWRVKWPGHGYLGSFRGVKWPGRGVDHQLLSVVRVENE